MIEPAEIDRALRAAFADARVLEVHDLTGTKDHYRVVLECPAFAGKSRVEQHRMVHAALGALLHGPIHALVLETRAGTSLAT